MGRRLDQERQNKLEPTRGVHAVTRLKQMGFDTYYDGKKITFVFKGQEVTYFPYSGRASGKSIKDGRGFENLVKQIQP